MEQNKLSWSWLAISGFIISILSIAYFFGRITGKLFHPSMDFLGLISPIISIILGSTGVYSIKHSGKKGIKLATASIIFGIIGLILWIILMIYIILNPL